MYTDYFYVIVMKYVEKSFSRDDKLRSYRLLFIRFPKNWHQLCFTIPKNVAVPTLKQNDRVRLKIHFFTRGLSNEPNFTIVAVEKIED